MPVPSLASVSHATSWIVLFSAKLSVKITQDLLSVRIKVSVWVSLSGTTGPKKVVNDYAKLQHIWPQRLSSLLLRFQHLFHVLLKPIYILNYLSGECWGQGKLRCHNNESKQDTADFWRDRFGLMGRRKARMEQRRWRRVGGRGGSMKDSPSKVFILEKNHFLWALLFIFPVAFILINAVIQQVVWKLLLLASSRLLPQ